MACAAAGYSPQAQAASARAAEHPLMETLEDGLRASVQEWDRGDRARPDDATQAKSVTFQVPRRACAPAQGARPLFRGGKHSLSGDHSELFVVVVVVIAQRLYVDVLWWDVCTTATRRCYALSRVPQANIRPHGRNHGVLRCLFPPPRLRLAK